ncbi:uncharacterized protein BJ171DRAFT_502996 [Polychytrium aggregatum]|uniref:uncharacterized protein n=1 Tax=Polychytrium aggregatum TaxID=110093 RepID=UPI0022FDDA43|nr:uncharacterized protein BJ171DRAFT_502996 [Polychytrium aggregatum]KAI9205100.1 hypothetical protein BJ171DRAFT_502996 [Polychytrium aggregatum]
MTTSPSSPASARRKRSTVLPLHWCSVPFGRKPTGTDLRGWITANYCARALRAMGYSVVCEPRCEIWSADTEVLLAELDQPMASAPSTTDPSTESSTALHNVVIPSASVEPTQRPAGKYLRRLFHGDVQTRMHWEHLWSRWKDETQAIFCAYNLSLSIEADALAHSHATVQSRLEQLPDVFQHESKLILDMTTHGLGRMVLRDSANDIDDAASFQFAADVAQLLDQQSKASRRVHLCEHSKEYYWKQCAKAADLFSKYHKSTTLAPLARTLNDAVAAAPSTPRALPSHVAFASLAQFDHPTTAADGLFGCLERASKHMFGICMDRTYDDIDATNSGRESDSVRDAVGGLSQISRLSESLGLSVIVMQILSFKRSRSVKFEWTELLDHDGSSGVYCQYTHARLCGIERYCGVAVDLDADLEPLAQSPEALALALLLAQYPKIFIQGIFNMEASSLAAFLVNVASQVSSCNYGMRIKGQTQAVAQARLRVLGAAKAVLRHGLEVLGLDAVVEM